MSRFLFWNTSRQEDIDNREKMQALTLAKECYSMKLDLLTNATVVDDAIRFISSNHNAISSSSSSSSGDGHERQEDFSNQQEEAQKEKDTTTNQVF